MYRSALFILLIAALPIVIHQRLAAQTQKQLPILQVDPYWPQLSENWIIGVGAGVATDAENNVDHPSSRRSHGKKSVLQAGAGGDGIQSIGKAPEKLERRRRRVRMAAGE